MKATLLIGLLVSLAPMQLVASENSETRTNFDSIDFNGLDKTIDQIVEDTGVQTAGIAVIRNGEVVWDRTYGKLSPSTDASDSTLINVASVTKVTVAETVLHLVAQGKISLDEKIYHYWVDPDIRHDARHKLLTPRIILNHTTGFSNWRFNESDGQLKFHNEPGRSFGYSGEGMDYLLRFVEKKLGEPFEEIVKRTIFKDAAIKDAAMSPDESRFDKIAQSITTEGKFLGHYCRPNNWCQSEGVISGADDLVISANALGKFVALISKKQLLNDKLAKERKTVSKNWLENTETLKQQLSPSEKLSPKMRGFGLGWEVYDYGNRQVLGHGGSDWSEFAHVYFYTDTSDGVAIALNGQPEQSLRAMVAILKAIDPHSPILADHQRSFDEMTLELNQRKLAADPISTADIASLTDQELEKIILNADSQLFDLGFNQCDFETWNAKLANDLEFYDDRTGLNRDRKKEVNAFNRKCQSPGSLTRKLASSTVSRLNDFGAVQRGEHHFFEDGVFVGSGKFIHLWSLETGQWQVTRAISYEHKPTTK